MFRNKLLFHLLILFVVFLLSNAAGRAGAFEEIGSEEELMFLEIPVVTASSKREQPVTEAASSVKIITAEDIRMSGATNLGDVLRSVAGIDVRESESGQHVIGIRGFADTAHVLVTIDGNNVFMYHANHIFLDWAPIDLEEIGRVEIIKGPGGVFYGGSSFSGVINIVTKTPKEIDGTQINAYVGNLDTKRLNIIHGGTYKNLEYSLSAGRRRAREWEKPKLPQEKNHHSVNHFSGTAILHPDDISSLTSSYRYSKAENVISSVCYPETTFISLRYDRPDFWVRMFYNNHEKTFWDDTFEVKDTNCEVEIFRSFRWGANITSIGGYAKKTDWEVRARKGDLQGNKEDHGVKSYALNIENEFRLNEQFILTLGGRLEHYSMLDYLGLGRGSIIYNPSQRQSLRFTISSGYFIPSLFQHTNHGEAYPFAVGNSSLNEEKIITFELAYFNQITDRLKLNAATFYNEYSDLIDNTQSGPMENTADASQYGGELELDFLFTNELTGFVNYSYQKIRRDDFIGLEMDPEHKVNCGLRFKSEKWSLSSAFHYVDTYYELYLTSNPVFGRVGTKPARVDAYTTFEARVGYNISDNIELSVAAYNMFNDKHYESNPPNNEPGNWHTGDKIGRRFIFGASWRF